VTCLGYASRHVCDDRSHSHTLRLCSATITGNRPAAASSRGMSPREFIHLGIGGAVTPHGNRNMPISPRICELHADRVTHWPEATTLTLVEKRLNSTSLHARGWAQPFRPFTMQTKSFRKATLSPHPSAVAEKLTSRACRFLQDGFLDPRRVGQACAVRLALIHRTCDLEYRNVPAIERAFRHEQTLRRSRCDTAH